AYDRYARSLGRGPTPSRPQLSLHPPIPAGVFATGAAHPCVAACAPVLAHPRVRSGPVLAAPSAELAPARIHSAWPAGTGSGSDILQPEAERLEDVVLLDLIGAVEVGGCAGHPPGAMKASRGHAALCGPALERAARRWREAGQLAEPCGLELRVEHPLPLQLAPARDHHSLSYARRRFPGRLRGQRLEGHPAHGDLDVDPVQQRAGEPALVRVDSGRCAAADPQAI